jgi:hypothetical protein
MPLSTIFQLYLFVYRGSQFYWWGKSEYTENGWLSMNWFNPGYIYSFTQ